MYSILAFYDVDVSHVWDYFRCNPYSIYFKKNKSQPWETSTTQIDLSLIVCRGDGKDLKIKFELHKVSIANFVDLNEINKKVIEGNIPGSLLGDTEGTQRSKIA